VDELIFINLKEKADTLNLSKLGLDQIPKQVFDLEHLKVLKLMANNIRIVPKEISKLTRLSHLHLYQNKVENLPKDILKEMPFLECIDVAENPISYEEVDEIYEEQEKWFDYRRFVGKLDETNPKEESIYFSGNLHVIPEQLFDFSELISLSIHGQNLTEIPIAIRKLKKLKYFDFSSNKISEIPKELIELNNIESIGLDGNLFTDFPNEILRLPNIKSISFNYNKITQIRSFLDDVAQVESIRHFSFGANPLEDFEPDLFKGGLSYIREYVYGLKMPKA